MKVLWLTNMPTIYRVHFFNELGKLCDLKVVFERYSATGVENTWNDSLAQNFKAYFLDAKPIGREASISISMLKYVNNDFDIVVVSSYSSPTEILAIIKMLVKKIPYVLAVDGGIIKEDSFLLKKLKTFLIGHADYWLSTGVSTNTYLENYGAKSEKIYKYPFTTLFEEDIVKCILDRDEKIKIREQLGMHEEKIILSVGQFIYRKGFDILLKSCKELNDNVGVYIVGGKVTKDYLKLIEELNINNIHFVENQPKEILKEYYKSADLFVLPTREDIWGLVHNDAMAYGLPVITTEKCVAGLELIKNYENGFIIPIEDEISLYEKMNIILKDEKIRNYMSTNNLNKIHKYTIENMAIEHIKIFNQIVDENRR